MSRDNVDLPIVRSESMGPFDITEDADTLSLRLDNRGELSLSGCLVFCLLLFGVFTLAALAIFQFASEPTQSVHRGAAGLDNPGRILNPSDNQFGLLWLLSAVGLLLGIPFYLKKTYQSALVFSFKRSADLFTRNDRVVTQLRRVENIVIKEIQDPDGRYLYDLELGYGDGRELQLHSGYDEREMMNIANKISRFVGVKIILRDSAKSSKFDPQQYLF